MHPHILFGASELFFFWSHVCLYQFLIDLDYQQKQEDICIWMLFGTLLPCYLFNWVHSSVSVSSFTIWTHHIVHTLDCIPVAPQEYGVTVGCQIWAGFYLNYLLLLCNAQNWGIKILDVMLDLFKGVGYQHTDVSPSICKGVIRGSPGLVVLSLQRE